MLALPDGAKVRLHGQLFVSTSPALGMWIMNLSPVAFGSGRPSSPAPAFVKSFSATAHDPLTKFAANESVNPRLSVHDVLLASVSRGRPVGNCRDDLVLPRKVDEVQVIMSDGDEPGTEIMTLLLLSITAVPDATLNVSAPSSAVDVADVEVALRSGTSRAARAAMAMPMRRRTARRARRTGRSVTGTADTGANLSKCDDLLRLMASSTASSQLGRTRYAKATAVVLDTSTVRLPTVHQAAGLTPLLGELPRVGSYSAHRLAVNGLDGARRRPHRPHIRHR